MVLFLSSPYSLVAFVFAFIIVACGMLYREAIWSSEAMAMTPTLQKQAAAITASPKRVFCFGDSLTAGTSPPGHELYPYAEYLERALISLGPEGTAASATTVRWRGYPGWTSSSLLTDSGFAEFLGRSWKERNENESPQSPQSEQQQQLSLPSFDLLIVLAGTNDLAHGTESEAIFDSIKGIHDMAHNTGCHNTLALGIPPSGWQAHSESARALATSVNKRLESWAAEESNSNYSDSKTVAFVPFPIETFDRSSDLWSPDGLHLSKSGYEFLGTSLAPIVAEIIWKQDEHDTA